jgi:single-strand DNA-binding protein
MDLNKVSLIGNLVKEPVMRKIPSGQTVATSAIATNYIWRDLKTKKQKKSVEFHNIVAWGHLADVMAEYLKKGAKVYVEGRLQNRSWDDKDGKKHYMTEVVVEDLIMLGHRTKDSKTQKSAEALAKEEPAVEDME